MLELYLFSKLKIKRLILVYYDITYKDSHGTWNGILKVENWRRRPPGLIPPGKLLKREHKRCLV